MSRTTARRASAFDPRLLVGVGLVLASVAGVVGIVTAADRTVDVYAAARPLSPGDRITADAVAVRSVHLGAVEEHYLLAGSLPEAGMIATRPVAAGELVPSAATDTADAADGAVVVATIAGALPGAVESGAVVDLWAAPATGAREFGAPAMLVGGATVLRVVEEDGMVAGAVARDVELLVPRDELAAVLAALGNGDALSLVPLAITAGSAR